MKSGIFIILFFFPFSLLAQSRPVRHSLGVGVCQVIQCCRGVQKECFNVACPAGMPLGECCYLLDNRWFFGFGSENCSG